jgi:phospholipid/cholesterol/gamma-HCH transport system permease protein
MPTGILRISLSGNWRAQSGLPGIKIIKQFLSAGAADKSLEFDATNLTGWDSRFVAFINKCVALCRDRNLNLRSDGLPEGVRRLVRLANAVPEKKDARVSASKSHFVQKFGEHALKVWQDALPLITFGN